MQALELQAGVRVRFDDSGDCADPDIFVGLIEESPFYGWRIRIEQVEETSLGISRGETWMLGEIVDDDDLSRITVIGGEPHYLH